MGDNDIFYVQPELVSVYKEKVILVLIYGVVKLTNINWTPGGLYLGFKVHTFSIQSDGS